MAPLTGAPFVRSVRVVFRRMAGSRGRPYPRGHDHPPAGSDAGPEAELSETETTEIEERLRGLGYID